MLWCFKIYKSWSHWLDILVGIQLFLWLRSKESLRKHEIPIGDTPFRVLPKPWTYFNKNKWLKQTVLSQSLPDPTKKNTATKATTLRHATIPNTRMNEVKLPRLQSILANQPLEGCQSALHSYEGPTWTTKKNILTFQYTGWFIGILMMAIAIPI